MEWVPHRNCCCCSNCFTIGANSDTEPKEKGSDGTEQGEDVRKRARYSGLVLCIAYDVCAQSEETDLIITYAK